MSGNQALAYMAPGVVERQAADCPVLALGDRRCDHGVVLDDGLVPRRQAA
jgi:glutathione-independent formaldehyde dehydrogenase